jgi:hypothetical protein
MQTKGKDALVSHRGRINVLFRAGRWQKYARRTELVMLRMSSRDQRVDSNCHRREIYIDIENTLKRIRNKYGAKFFLFLFSTIDGAETYSSNLG